MDNHITQHLAEPMASREYETMYDAEDGYWWYIGIRAIARSLIAASLAAGPSTDSDIHILDAGCGTGGNFDLLREFGHVTGVDVSREAARFIRRRNIRRFAVGSVTELPFPNNAFDVVTTFDVNQVLPDDAPAFHEYWRVLKPGGWLYFSEVAFESLRGEHDLAVGISRRYTRRDIAARLIDAGFDMERLSYANTLLFPPIFVLRRARRLILPVNHPDDARSDFHRAPQCLHRVFKAMLLLEARLLKYINLPFGVTIVGLARKPNSCSA